MTDPDPGGLKICRSGSTTVIVLRSTCEFRFRRSSDGAISLMENSNDEDNCSSPVSLGATDWTEAAVSTSHIFVPTGGSVQACYLGTVQSTDI